MITPNAGLQMRNGDDVVNDAPSVEDVLSLMTRIRAHVGLDLPPEICLQFPSSTLLESEQKPRLLLILAFRRACDPKWIVEFSIPGIRGSTKLLVTRLPLRPEFEAWTCCGLISRYRAEALIEEESLLRPAIDWFLKNHSPCPSLNWLDYGDCVLPADNSLYG